MVSELSGRNDAFYFRPSKICYTFEDVPVRGGSRGRQISRATEVKIAYFKKFDSSYL